MWKRVTTSRANRAFHRSPADAWPKAILRNSPLLVITAQAGIQGPQPLASHALDPSFRGGDDNSVESLG